METPINGTVVDKAALDTVENPDSMPVQPDFALTVGGGQQAKFTGSIWVPYLTVVQGVGELSQIFHPGDLVLGKENLIAEKGEVIRMIIINFKEYWKEYVDSARWTKGDRPAVFRTEKEALDAGHTTEFDQVTRAMPSAPRAMSWSLLIEKPDKVMCSMFCIHANGKVYAPARMAIERSAYLATKDAFGVAVNHATAERGIHTAVWEMRTAIRKARTGNVTWVPNIKMLTEPLTVEQVAELAKALGTSNA